MEIRWARLAALDLDRIFEHIRKENPVAAGEVVQAIYDGCGSLKDFPQHCVRMTTAELIKPIITRNRG